MDPTVIAALIGLLGTILGSVIAYKAALRQSASSNTIVEDISSFDYVRHLQKHKLPIDGIRVAFTNADSIDQLSRLLKTLSKEPITCSWFEPESMKGKYLLSINLVRSHLNLQVFNRKGLVASSDDPDPYTHF